jgi:hypothetical protein
MELLHHGTGVRINTGNHTHHSTLPYRAVLSLAAYCRLSVQVNGPESTVKFVQEMLGCCQQFAADFVQDVLQNKEIITQPLNEEKEYGHAM